MKIFENYNKAKQKFGENLAQQAINAKIPSKFIFAACKFNAENGTPFNDLYSLFSQWTTYVAPKNKNVNIDILDYNTFWNTIQDCKKQYEQESKVYDDGTVSITHISSFEQMKNLPIKNLWCIRRGKRWKEYQENGAVFYLIINNNYTDDSNCRYVMVEMYPNGDIGYWSTDNELIDEQGSTRRLPSLAEYQQTLGNALQKIQELHQQVMNNNQLNCNLNMNKKLIRLTEQDIHRIVKESVNKILNEIGDTAKGQYMLGRLQGRQMGNGNKQQAMNTQSYANKQMGNRTPQNFQSYDAAETANQMGYNDERNPQHSQDMMTNGGSIGNYQANIRNNYLRGVSKF